MAETDAKYAELMLEMQDLFFSFFPVLLTNQMYGKLNGDVNPALGLIHTSVVFCGSAKHLATSPIEMPILVRN